MKIVVLTGAGISAESGISTFRDSDGLWEGHDPMQVATPEAFDADPDLVQRFYDERRNALRRAEPNAAHTALARLEYALGDNLFLVTQNVDDLHERAGSRTVHHMHGSLRSAWCTSCGARTPWRGALATKPNCPSCGVPAMRPDIVWFGEMPYGMDAIEDALAACDLFVAIGTSAVVYPAAGFVNLARRDTLELNLADSAASDEFARSVRGPATAIVPTWVDEVFTQLGIEPGTIPHTPAGLG